MKGYLIGVVALALILATTGCGSHGSPLKGTRYNLDKKASGWVKITYNRAGGKLARLGTNLSHDEPDIPVDRMKIDTELPKK